MTPDRGEPLSPTSSEKSRDYGGVFAWKSVVSRFLAVGGVVGVVAAAES
jgi:hypothetical protein